jgi:hypothetical protein
MVPTGVWSDLGVEAREFPADEGGQFDPAGPNTCTLYSFRSINKRQECVHGPFRTPLDALVALSKSQLSVGKGEASVLKSQTEIEEVR